MIACFDVYYLDASQQAQAAAVVFHDWQDSTPAEERVVTVNNVELYEPGQFYRRELPCLLAVLKTLPPLEIAVVDGYVWLEGADHPGLGAHLHSALDRRTAVIGVAKTRYRGATGALEITRGSSTNPLFITAAGLPVEQAAEYIRSMHGHHRIPTLLARVDQLCRTV